MDANPPKEAQFSLKNGSHVRTRIYVHVHVELSCYDVDIHVHVYSVPFVQKLLSVST